MFSGVQEHGEPGVSHRLGATPCPDVFGLLISMTVGAPSVPQIITHCVSQLEFLEENARHGRYKKQKTKTGHLSKI